jgi:hypothetical protein
MMDSRRVENDKKEALQVYVEGKEVGDDFR